MRAASSRSFSASRRCSLPLRPPITTRPRTSSLDCWSGPKLIVDLFLILLNRNADKLSPSEHENRGELHYDAVIIGGGLAGTKCWSNWLIEAIQNFLRLVSMLGLTTALSLLDKGATVAILEKERFFGGNSAWASSGRCDTDWINWRIEFSDFNLLC